MIDEKKIEEAADKYAVDTYAFNEPVPTEYKEGIQEVFQTSINWFKENLWHDASEYPKLDKSILLELASNDYVVVKLRNKYEFSQYPYTKISRWLYIEDLMKGGIHE